MNGHQLLDAQDPELAGPHLLPARPTGPVRAHQAQYVHIDALFGEPGRNVIDFGCGCGCGFDLIKSRFRQLMRVAVSVRRGAISSAQAGRGPDARGGMARNGT
ncbi:hypothetical protein ACIOEW_07735 [Streptomyces sp. NPDC087901]|uniref:hypothetical protein n=1 Tax=Streptomyces sp. NPDC087901 TaxID=3365818 RepID=UPI003814B5F2